jgi:hypothetical protein
MCGSARPLSVVGLGALTTFIVAPHQRGLELEGDGR